MKHKVPLLIIMVIILLGGVTAGYYHYLQQENKPLTLYGNVDIRTVDLAFRVAGRLETLHVDEGDTVKQNDVIAQLDPEPYRIALAQAQANVASFQAALDLLQAGYRSEEIAQVRAAVQQAQATFDYAQSFWVRQQGLWGKKATSANELANSRTARDQAEANLQSARDKLNQYMAADRSAPRFLVYPPRGH